MTFSIALPLPLPLLEWEDLALEVAGFFFSEADSFLSVFSFFVLPEFHACIVLAPEPCAFLKYLPWDPAAVETGRLC